MQIEISVRVFVMCCGNVQHIVAVGLTFCWEVGMNALIN